VLTSFYLFSILTCLIRVLSYSVIIAFYFIKNEYIIGVAVRADMLTSTTLLILGITQTIVCVHLGRVAAQINLRNDQQR